MSAERTATQTAFATLGAFATAQQIAAGVLESVDQADPGLVVEEAMALLSVVTARAMPGNPAAAAALASLPLTWKDYVVGGELLSRSAEEVEAEEGTAFQRLGRALAFYEAHFPVGAVPGPRALKDKMELWMGRVSPPALPESPPQRLEKLGLVDVVAAHVRLIRAFDEQD